MGYVHVFLHTICNILQDQRVDKNVVKLGDIVLDH